MKIELHEYTVEQVASGYSDSGDGGVVGLDGKLNIRPEYQREFIYKDKQRDEVVYTVQKNFPLNVLYWVKNDDGTFEVLDGQQRTISICQYVTDCFSVQVGGYSKQFSNLTPDEQKQILEYPLQIYVCEGTASEKLDWFKIINIAGEQLTDQELRNAVYHGPFVSAAKGFFSKPNNQAHNIADKYLSGSSIRQDYLQTALGWIASSQDVAIEDYMAKHQQDDNCSELWVYFQNVVNWINVTFPKYRKEMKGLPWGIFYNTYKDKSYDPEQLDARIAELMQDDDVTKKSGVYEYVLSGEKQERALNIRAFTDAMKRTAYEQQQGICPACGEHFEIDQMEADHITPWCDGGKTVAENCQMLCKECNRHKSSK